jgi:hypothetical protein
MSVTIKRNPFWWVATPLARIAPVDTGRDEGGADIARSVSVVDL